MADVDRDGYAPGVKKQVEENWSALSALYLSATPAFDGQLTLGHWEAIALACLARGHYAQQSVFAFHERRIDAAVLARVAFEHLVVFAWLLISPKEHHARLIRSEHDHVRDYLNDVGARSGQQFRGRDAHLQALLAVAAEKRIPKFVECAEHADEHWAKVVPTRTWDFRGAYANLYRPYSAYVHPLLSGFHSFISSGPDAVEISAVPDEESEPVHLLAGSTRLLADALLVCSHVFGWPDSGAVKSMATQGLAVEDGALVAPGEQS
jgi:hypothetical protein